MLFNRGSNSSKPGARIMAPTSRSRTSGFCSKSTAWALQTFLHNSHLRQFSSSIAYFKGTAWGNGTYIAFRTPSLSSNSLGTSTGQCSAQTPQPVHLSSFTYLGLFVILALKFPASPSTSSSLAFVISSTLGCLPAPTSFGARMHIEQSFVGNVLSNCAIVPPMLSDSSNK